MYDVFSLRYHGCDCGELKRDGVFVCSHDDLIVGSLRFSYRLDSDCVCLGAYLVCFVYFLSDFLDHYIRHTIDLLEVDQGEIHRGNLSLIVFLMSFQRNLLDKCCMMTMTAT